MQSYTIQTFITEEPQTSIDKTTVQTGATDIEPDDDEFGTFQGGATQEIEQFTITQSNGNILVGFTASESITFFSSWANPADPENDSGETVSADASYSSYVTNGRIFVGTDLQNLSQVGTLVTRTVARTTNTSDDNFASTITSTTQATINAEVLTTISGSGGVSFVPTAQEQLVATTTQTAGQSQSTILVTEQVEETGYSYTNQDGNTTLWPQYDTATVLLLNKNEVAWLVTTKSESPVPISSIAQSFTSRATVLPRFFTYQKDQSNIYDTNESGFLSTFLTENDLTFSAFSSQELVPLSVANTAAAQIPFPTMQGQTINVATSEGAVSWEYVLGFGGTKRIQTTTGIRSKGVAGNATNGITLENTYNVISTIPDEAPVAEIANTIFAASDETLIEGAVTRTIQTAGNTTEVREYTGNNSQRMGCVALSTFAAAGAEKSFYNAAAQHNGGTGTNFQLPIQLTGIPSMARLALIAATPFPTTYTASVNGQAATIGVGENITVEDSSSTTSYNAQVIGEALKTFGPKAPIRGGNSPDGQTLAIGPGRYEAHFANGGSTTTSFTAQTFFTASSASSEAVTAYRPIREYIGVGDIRYVVSTLATTATNPFL